MAARWAADVATSIGMGPIPKRAARPASARGGRKPNEFWQTRSLVARDDAVFVSRLGKPFTRYGAYRLIERCAARVSDLGGRAITPMCAWLIAASSVGNCNCICLNVSALPGVPINGSI